MESLALKACYHIARRYQTDAAFRHHMHYTESMAVVMEALAEKEGIPLEELRERIEENAAKLGPAEIVQLRSAVEAVAELANDAKYVGDENVPVARILDAIDASGVNV